MVDLGRHGVGHRGRALPTVIDPLPAKLAAIGGSGSNGAVGIVFLGAFATVGALLAWKRPGNPIGWLLSATGLTSPRRSSACCCRTFTGR